MYSVVLMTVYGAKAFFVSTAVLKVKYLTKSKKCTE